jgi:hypothetical protein
MLNLAALIEPLVVFDFEIIEKPNNDKNYFEEVK